MKSTACFIFIRLVRLVQLTKPVLHVAAAETDWSESHSTPALFTIFYQNNSTLESNTDWKRKPWNSFTDRVGYFEVGLYFYIYNPHCSFLCWMVWTYFEHYCSNLKHYWITGFITFPQVLILALCLHLKLGQLHLLSNLCRLYVPVIEFYRLNISTHTHFLSHIANALWETLKQQFNVIRICI